MTYLVLDLETDGTKGQKETYGRFCNQLVSRHKIIVCCTKSPLKGIKCYCNMTPITKLISPQQIIALTDIFSTYNVFNHVEYKEIPRHSPKFLQELKDIDVIVGQNLKFDLLWFWSHPGLREFIDRGGKIYDTKMAQYILDGHQNLPRSLKDLAVKYDSQMKDDVPYKYYYSQNALSSDVPKDILLPYCKGDVEITETVYLKQLKEIANRGLQKLVDTHMDHLLALCEIEFNGIKFDRDLCVTKTLELESRIEALKTRIVEAIRPTWRTPVEFNPSSNTHVSLALFGGTIINKERKPKIVDGSPVIIKSGKNKGTMQLILTPVEYVIKGILNVRPSSLGYKQRTNNKGEELGLYPVDDEVLQQCREHVKDSDFIQMLQEYRSQTKICGTYYHGFLNAYNPETGCVHTELNNSVTNTGRLSAKTPNVQNLIDDKDVLANLTTRFEDGVILAFDYKNLEPRCLAYLSQCPNYIRDVTSGVDQYVKQLSFMEERPYEELVKLCAEDPKWAHKRRSAKAVVLSANYGAGVKSRAEKSGLSQAVIIKADEAYAREYPEIVDFYEGLFEQVTKTRIPNILPGRHANSPIGFGYYENIVGARYWFSQWQKFTQATGRAYEAFNQPEMKNYIVQGFAAILVALASGKVFQYLKNHRDKALLINEVHDDLKIDCKNEYKDLIITDVTAIMNNVGGLFEEQFGVKFNVPMLVEVSEGKTLAGVKGL